MKKVFKIGCLTLVLMVLSAAGFLGFLLFGTNTYTTEDIAYYRAISGEIDGPNTLPILGQQIDIAQCPYALPYISDLGPCEDYRFNYTARRMSVFESHAYILIVEYDEREYGKRKALLEDMYPWLTEKIPGEHEGIAPCFELDGFQFRAVEGGYYPKEMLFAGTSEERCEIAYIYFYDFDLDWVGPSAEEFIREQTGWRKVVK